MGRIGKQLQMMPMFTSAMLHNCILAISRWTDITSLATYAQSIMICTEKVASLMLRV